MTGQPGCQTTEQLAGRDLQLLKRSSDRSVRFVAPGMGLVCSDSTEWLRTLPDRCLHGVVTDPPYGAVEYEGLDLEKMRTGGAGNWRIPPAIGGVRRRPVPRFTVLRPDDVGRMAERFAGLACELRRVLVPGAHVLVAGNPLLSHHLACAFSGAGLEVRGQVVRLVQTLRGGDRPKGAHEEFPGVTVMPRSCWEPWYLFRVPLDGTVAHNLRKWGTGGLRRISREQPFKDVIHCWPTRPDERAVAPHPSLKPQRFLRQVVRAILPLGRGIVLDPFAGSGSTVAAASAVGYESIGIERDPEYWLMACSAVPKLVAYDPGPSPGETPQQARRRS